MKKYLAWFLALVTALSLAACGGNSGGGSSGGGQSSGGGEKGLQVALCLSGAANDQGWNQRAR